MHLKVLITLFQKTIWFLEIRATGHEMLAEIDSEEILQNSSTSDPNISTVSPSIGIDLIKSYACCQGISFRSKI